MTRDDVFKAIDVADVDQLKSIFDSTPELASSKSNDGLSAVLFSLYIEQSDITDLLLSYGPELDLFDLAALGNIEQISVLLAAHPKAIHEYSGDGFSAIHIASYFGQQDVAEILLENDADINKIAMNGSDLTALHSAVSRGHIDVVRVLLEFDPEVDARMMGGFTPLMMASALGFSEMVELLIERGADKELVADDGRTASAFASAAGHDQLSELLSA